MTEETQDLYRNLQIHLDQFPIGFPATKSGVELRILKYLFNDEEAFVGTKLDWTYATLEQIYKSINKNKMSIAELEKTLDSMVKKGTLNFKTENETKFYANIPFVVGIFEYQVNKLTKNFIEDFSEYLTSVFGVELLGTKISQFRTIPIEESITPENHVANYDELKIVIENSVEPIGVANCVCRQSKDLIGEPCKQTDMRETCLYFGTVGQLFLSQGWARPINKKEALEILRKAEDNGLVMQAGNTEQPEFMCACCRCCCEILTKINLVPRPSRIISGNFYAEVNPDLCTGCGTCIERCPINAFKVTDGISKVILKRCIGCGVCVPTCPEEAIQLKKKDTEAIPPKTKEDLYAMIMNKKQELRKKNKRK